jgi:hypothetical protein
MKNNKLLAAFILIELLATILLSIKLLKKFGFNTQPVLITPINGRNTEFVSKSNLKSYYQPKANTQERVVKHGFYNAVYTINMDGLNERYDYSLKKPKNTFRILTLGDSFTFGIYVDTAKNWPEQLENLLQNKHCKKKIEVINLGVYGYDIQYAVARFADKGIKYDPDLVIWFLKKDDFLQINETLVGKVKQIETRLKQNGKFDKLVEDGVAYPAWSQAYSETVKQLGKNIIVQKQKKFLKQFQQLYNGKLVIISFPFLEHEYRELIEYFFNDQHNSFFTDSITDVVNKTDGLVFPFDRHLTEKGHSIIAKDVFNYLTKDNYKLIPCN